MTINHLLIIKLYIEIRKTTRVIAAEEMLQWLDRGAARDGREAEVKGFVFIFPSFTLFTLLCCTQHRVFH